MAAAAVAFDLDVVVKDVVTDADAAGVVEDGLVVQLLLVAVVEIFAV